MFVVHIYSRLYPRLEREASTLTDVDVGKQTNKREKFYTLERIAISRHPPPEGSYCQPIFRRGTAIRVQPVNVYIYILAIDTEGYQIIHYLPPPPRVYANRVVVFVLYKKICKPPRSPSSLSLTKKKR